MKLTIELTQAEYEWLETHLHALAALPVDEFSSHTTTVSENIWHKLREAYGAAVQSA